MSLARLLTSGKSLVGLKNSTSRYRMRSKNLLPKFGSDKNPFSAMPEAEPLPATQTPANSIPRYQMTPAELAAARLKDTTPLPAAAPLQSVAPAKSAAKLTELFGAMKRFLKQGMERWKLVGRRLKPFARVPQRKPQARAAALIADPAREPVQGELSLDRVKVVRNDLSDADVEIVPAKQSVKPAAKSKTKTEPSTPAEAEVELIKT